MAAALRQELSVEPVLLVGSPGEFTVWVEAHKVAEKLHGAFPDPGAVVAAVRAALEAEGGAKAE